MLVEEKPIQNTPAQIRLPLLLAVALAGGIFIGATMFGDSKNRQLIGKGYMKFREILNYIDQNYVDTVNTEELVDYSIEKMLEKLDPHSTYFPAKEVEMANMQLEGDFDGIGVEFNIFKDTLYVVSPITGGPSESVGIQSGDKIVQVNGENIAGANAKLDNAKVFKWLRGKKGSQVKLGILRKGNPKVQNFTVTRDKIPSYSVDVAMMIDQQTGYIKVTRFAANTYAEFKEAMTKLKSKGMKRLLLDLRDNPGGYMDKAVGMVDELVGGNAMIVYQDGKGSRFDSESRAKVNGIFEKGAVIVLINEGSASASEIIAGALQDNDRALVVGRRSFGKGLVQLPIDLSDGSELRLTISRYYTPSGRSIQKPFAAYEEDMKRRYDKGEFFYEDSIKLDKSKTYKTRKGRTVYGGGGIMPDIFVPMDTGKFTYLNQLFQENIIREYAFNYYNDNKATLSKMKYEDFKQSFKVTEKMLNQITEMGRKANITADPLSIQASQKLIQMHTKALIARSIWKNEGFYPIIFEEDEVFQEAIKHFAEADKIVN